MHAGVGAVPLFVKVPLREQALTLGSEGREKFVRAAGSLRQMEARWVGLIDQKLEDIQALEQRAHYAAQRKLEHDDAKHVRVPFNKSAFDFSPRPCSSMYNKEKIATRVLDEIRADHVKAISDARTEIAKTMMMENGGEDATTTSIKYKALLEERLRLAISSDDIHLPWPECLPSCILLNATMRPYMDAWYAELDNGGGGGAGGGGGGGAGGA